MDNVQLKVHVASDNGVLGGGMEMEVEGHELVGGAIPVGLGKATSSNSFTFNDVSLKLDSHW